MLSGVDTWGRTLCLGNHRWSNGWLFVEEATNERQGLVDGFVFPSGKRTNRPGLRGEITMKPVAHPPGPGTHRTKAAAGVRCISGGISLVRSYRKCVVEARSLRKRRRPCLQGILIRARGSFE